MESRFAIDLKYRVELHDPPGCTAIFLNNPDLGFQVPIAIEQEELQYLTVALEEGIGATPPDIQEIVASIERTGLYVTKISVLDFDIEENDFLTVAFMENCEHKQFVTKLDIVSALMLSVYAAAPIMVDADAIIHQQNAGTYESVFAEFEDFKQSDDYEERDSN